MGKNTKIEWTGTPLDDGTIASGHTFNPWIGCAKVSDGCKHCYAETLMDTRYGRVQWGPDGMRVKTSEKYWKDPLKWNREAKEQGHPVKVFCGSLCDVFESRPDVAEWRLELLDLIEATPDLNWLLLTKRPGDVPRHTLRWWDGWPDNVWLGASASTQEAANERIPLLLGVPAAGHFLSLEPLLEFVSLKPEWLKPPDGLDWLIAGGESGPRECDVLWLYSLRMTAQLFGAKYFVKQLGTNPVLDGQSLKGHFPLSGKNDRMADWPHCIQVREYPK
jgi:protein gp37